MTGAVAAWSMDTITRLPTNTSIIYAIVVTDGTLRINVTTARLQIGTKLAKSRVGTPANKYPVIRETSTVAGLVRNLLKDYRISLVRSPINRVPFGFIDE